MKKIYSLKYSIVISVFALLNSCETKEDYSDIIYKNYLTYEIESAEYFLESTIEGSKEGEFKDGSKQTFQTAIDKAKMINNDESSLQKQVDQAYTDLLNADTAFYDQMVPFRSFLQLKIDYADYIHSYHVEGSEEGNVPSGSKAILSTVINEVKTQFSDANITQRKVDELYIKLTNVVLAYNESVYGKANIEVVNKSFEMPGRETDDLKEVTGWSNYGKIEDWMTKAAIVKDSSATDGEYVAKIGTYTTGIYQNLKEVAQPNSSYKLSVDISMLSNNKDWQNNKYPAVFLTRFIVFNNAVGDYNFVTVLSEQYDTLGLTPSEFKTLEHTLELDNIDAFEGKRIAIDFIERHSWDALNPIYAESSVIIDNIKITRD